MTLTARHNAFVAQETTAPTQLTYSLQINPAPLTVSIPDEVKVLGSLEFVVTNHTALPLNVESVEFQIEVGDLPSLTPSITGIAKTVSDQINWIVLAPEGVVDGLASYTLLPAANSPMILAPGVSVVVQLFQIETNAIPGNSTVKIKETVDSLVAFTSFQVTTFPTGFYFNSLAAMVDRGSGLVPVAQVGAGETVTLIWNSSVVDTNAFTIYYSDASKGQQPDTTDTHGKWTSKALTTDTVFTVVAKVDVEGGQPLTASLSTVVSVQNPILIAGSINTLEATVNNNASIAGRLTANAIESTSLSVKGSGVVSLSDSGAISASGEASLGSAVISRTLSVTEQTTLGAVSAQSLSAGSLKSGDVTVDGKNVEIPVNYDFGAALSDRFTYEGFTPGAYSLGWFKDPWAATSGPTAWLAAYGGIKFFTGGKMPEPAFTIDFHGDCLYYGKMGPASSIAFKENIRSLTADEASDMLNHLDPVQYTRKTAHDGRTYLGFIAEHVPSAVASPDRKAIFPDEIVAVLTRVVKEQQQMIQKLEQKVNALEAKK